MPDDDLSKLTPATEEEVRFALSFALRFDGRKRHHRADETMANIVAEHLAEHLRRSNMVVMKKPPGRSPAIAARPGWPGPER